MNILKSNLLMYTFTIAGIHVATKVFALVTDFRYLSNHLWTELVFFPQSSNENRGFFGGVLFAIFFFMELAVFAILVGFAWDILLLREMSPPPGHPLGSTLSLKILEISMYTSMLRNVAANTVFLVK